MATDSLALLDRQHALLSRQEGAAFVQELKRFHDLLAISGPRDIIDAVETLRTEAAGIERDFETHDAQLVPALVSLKARLVERAPDIDDSDASRPMTQVPSMAWTYSLANFDQVASDGPDRLLIRQGVDESRSGMLLRILENKLRTLKFVLAEDGPVTRMSDSDLRPDLDDLARELRNLSERHRHRAQALSAAVETHGGIQMLYLDMAVSEMNPEPVFVGTAEEEQEKVSRMIKRVLGGMQVLEDAAAGRTVSGVYEQMLESHVAQLKSAAAKVYEAVRYKLATAADPLPLPQTYLHRLKAWMLSPGYQLIGGPGISGAVTQVITKEKGAAVFALLALAALVVPPSLRHVPDVTYTLASVTFILAASAAVVIALIASGIGIALLMFSIAILAFGVGRLSTAEDETRDALRRADS